MSLQYPPEDTYFGLALTSHRDKDLGVDATSYFQYECLVAGIAVMFCRWTVKSSSAQKEPLLLRIFFALSLGFLAYSKKSYELIIAVEIFSYFVPLWLSQKNTMIPTLPGLSEKNSRLLWIAVSAVLSFLISHSILSLQVWTTLISLIPEFIQQGLEYLLPIPEMKEAHSILAAFGNPAVLQKQMSHLFFVTFHIQVGMGYLGIDFLRQEQSRRNQLVRMDMIDDKADDANHKDPQSPGKKSSPRLDASKRFQKSAFPFIFLTALPYMLQIITFGNINRFSFLCFQNDVHRVIRLNELFDHDAHLVAMANDSATSPGVYAESMNQVVTHAYDLFNRKLFSLPKLLLIPGIIMKQPMLVAQISPFIFASDYIKGRAVAYMTSTSERLDKEAKDLGSIRTKVEAFDMKNAELLQRSGQGATAFTQRRWEELTVRMQQKKIVSDLMKRTKAFFQFMQRSFVFTVLIDCALANLIAVGKIVSADTFVFSRAIEDAVDLVLMRSRAESELAHMSSEIDRLRELKRVWDAGQERSLIPCTVAPKDTTNHGLIIRNLHYSRGSAMVRTDHIEFPPGIYALTGVNGSGKSTLFRVFMACNTNEKSIDLPSSLNMLTPMEPFVEESELSEEACPAVDDESCVAEPEATEEVEHEEKLIPQVSLIMPSSDVAEISQSFYWPLYTRPIDWIFQRHVDKDEETELALRVAKELQSLDFRQAASTDQKTSSSDDSPFEAPADDTINRVAEELLDEKEDWFNDLSGGQKSKVELVRKVFLHGQCPGVLLIDETMAPLDPGSKSVVMARLKQFCQGSVVIVIYHTDAGKDGAIECVPSNAFFDANIHLVNHTLVRRPVC